MYLQSCIEKTAQTEWATGNNLYYTALGVFGLSDPVGVPLARLLENEATVRFLTWSVLALEFALAVTLLTPFGRRLGGLLPDQAPITLLNLLIRNSAGLWQINTNILVQQVIKLWVAATVPGAPEVCKKH
ncbi:hypothetical protein [Arthrobacter sp. NPDC058127]|uniref:hypothetical protein n=1 Tax=Arthrobacter sp. NPDC058127 TaxID=3346351 RepID=UPI0036DFD8FF